MSNLTKVNRRNVLRSMGACITLPWMAGLLPKSAWSRERTDRPPTRLCCWYTPNGMHLPSWFPKRAGALLDLPESLEPLSFASQYLTTFEGLTHNSAMTNGDDESCGHGQGSGSLLTGAQAFRSQDDVRVGISIDQLYAKHVGNATPLPSLELGCESPRSGNAFGYSGTYKTHISWRTATSPAPYEINPKLVFDRLFTHGDNAAVQATIAERAIARAFSTMCSMTPKAQRRRLALPTKGNSIYTCLECAR